MIDNKLLITIIGISFAGLLSACGTSPPARLYLLEPVATGNAVQRGMPLTIVVNEVTLAEHLTRKEILSRNRHFEVSAAPFDRWAESLESNITSVLAENLAVLSPSDKVISHPWTFGGRADFTVSVQVLAFGPDPSGDVTLNAIWRIADSGGGTLELQRASYSQPRSTDDVVATVTAMSVVLGELSSDIAASLRASSTASVQQPG